MYTMTTDVDPTPVDNVLRINGSSTVLFWMDWVMVWHASRLDSFVPRWTLQVYHPLQVFIIDWLL